ncbi:MAG: hypothetical protein KKB39_04820 [Nanoarchaeota archaeon]|nr:hypothetical protein [Nanoarchaeota archaeon]
MKLINVPAIYIASDKIKTKDEKERLKRLLTKINSDNIIEMPSNLIYHKLLQEGLFKRENRTGLIKHENPIIIFSGFNWQEEINNPRKGKVFIPYREGQFNFADFRDKNQLLSEKGVYCNSGFEIHTAFGCFNSCKYCHVGKTYTIMLDIEKFIDNLEILMKNNPQQNLYKYDNQCDIPDLEPEYGAINKIIEFFSKTDKYLMLYTKSNNLDYLPSFDQHKGNTLVCWTISCDDVAKNYEINASSLDERVEAAKKCQDKGYKIRFRFSPIIPIKDWKKKNREMIKKIFDKTMPEVICLEMLCHMNKEQCNSLFPDLELPLNENITEYGLFSDEEKIEVYGFFIDEIRKYDKNVKLALCLETEKVWNELKGKLGVNPTNFFCCCGENCV